MINRQLIVQLKQLRQVQPRNEWKEDLKAQLLSQIRAYEVDKPKFNIVKFIREYNPLTPFVKGELRSVLITGLILAIFLSGSIFTVQAAKNSLPGHFLYPLKIAIEKTRTLLAINRENKVKLEVEFADQRLEEFGQIVQKYNPLTLPRHTRDRLFTKGESESIAKAVQDFQDKLNTTKTGLEELRKSSENSKSVEVAKIIDKKTAEFENTLNKTCQKMSAAGKEGVEKKLAATLEIIDQTNTQALKLIVEKQKEDISSEEGSEILARVEDKIKRVEKKTEDPEDKKTLAQVREDLTRKNLFMALETVEEIQNMKNETENIACEKETIGITETLITPTATVTQTAEEESRIKNQESGKNESGIRNQESRIRNYELGEKKEEEKVLDESEVKADFKGDLLFEPKEGVYGGLLRN